MQLVNTETIPGWNITEVKGIVSGNTIRAKHLGRDIGAAFKNMAGGELKAYTELLAESRAEATSRMIAEAQALGASAIVNVRFTTSTVAGVAFTTTAFEACTSSLAGGGAGVAFTTTSFAAFPA